MSLRLGIAPPHPSGYTSTSHKGINLVQTQIQVYMVLVGSASWAQRGWVSFPQKSLLHLEWGNRKQSHPLSIHSNSVLQAHLLVIIPVSSNGNIPSSWPLGQVSRAQVSARKRRATAFDRTTGLCPSGSCISSS